MEMAENENVKKIHSKSSLLYMVNPPTKSEVSSFKSFSLCLSVSQISRDVKF